MVLRKDKPAWRDLWLVPIALVGIFVCSAIEMLIALNFHAPFNEDTLNGVGALGQMLSYIIVLIVFYYFHYQEMPERLRAGWHYVRKRWLFLLITLLVVMGVETLYNQLMSMLPEGIGFKETQNEESLASLFKNPAFLPFSFLFVVILAPVVEELFFRNVIIGELGKKFNYIVMGIISALAFAAMHVIGAASPFEFGSYFIIAVALVLVYFKSGKSTAATIFIHLGNNLVSFLMTVFFS
ncbi:CPBP family intramembrane glutamic endopeptidase [Staphylococcus debuckii]|uniref:CPBP family intramembrane glutamic endopeptidase n=1 Tax=Staphylococcus debuckii TaxID=2044912 RepID=UPI000F42D757|nr:type II CAAX endopeptidase family protein [Staphylococcus debuckii]AYU55933.1 CPBP family intramembrane metalloprotease [Staphylococcus debuckii]